MPRTSPTWSTREASPSSWVRIVAASFSACARNSSVADLVENGERGGAGDRVAAERPAEAPGVRRVHHLGPAGDRGQRQPASERLAGHEQVRLGLVVLDRPDRPRPTDPGLHLVVHVQDAVLSAQLGEPAREVGGHVDEAALALDRLEHDAGDLVPVDQRGEGVERVVRGHASVRVRAGRAIDLGRERAEALLVDLLVRHRHRQEGAAVEGVVEDDDPGASGRGASDLDRVLDRLGTRVQEQALLVLPRARRQLGEPAADLDVRLVHPDHEALVQVAVDLLVHRGDRGREAVARVLTAQAAGEVDVRLAVDVNDPGAFRALHHDRRRGDSAGDVLLAGRQDALTLGALCHRHETILS